MSPYEQLGFREIWCVDFEFYGGPGDLPEPVCMVAHELVAGRKIRMWRDELMSRRIPPYATDDDCMFVSYSATAELGCHLVLGWPFPANVLDLYAEFRCLTNGCSPPSGSGLLGALIYFGLDSMGAGEKQSMRELILTGGPWSDEERDAILEYCEGDVRALERLLPKMVGKFSLPHALLRGRYTKAATRMENTGVPIDMEALEALRANWFEIQDRMIIEVDKGFGVYEGRTFKIDRWDDYVTRQGIRWPRLPSGKPNLQEATFKDMAIAYPLIRSMHQLRSTLSKLKRLELAVGADGRNRCPLKCSRSSTNRNQPSSNKFIFTAPSWLRSLIKPGPGKGVAYIDWSQQEFGIAAFLSGDENMMAAYLSGDPYLAFAIQAGAVPPGATRETHWREREKFKSCVLAVQYGMEAWSLAQRIGCTEYEARELLNLHRKTYPKFWKWSQAVLDHAELRRKLWTTYGWYIHYPATINPRSVMNFPMQANGAEMMRLAACFGTERGVRVCAPVHDAFLIEFELAEEEEAIRTMQGAMQEASACVLGGYKLTTDVKVVRYPDRYMDKRGKTMWDLVWGIVGNLKG